MANWAGLPTEILHSIFELLEGRMRDYERSWESFFPLYDCLLVCKNWTGPALLHLYRAAWFATLPHHVAVDSAT